MEGSCAKSKYSSLRGLLLKLRAAGISVSGFETKDAHEPYILFAIELELNAAQLSILGLKRPE